MTARSGRSDASGAGRICPLRYRYGAAAIARVPERRVSTLYVIGGLYGNTIALAQIAAMAEAEASSRGQGVRLCFNGDFNWFNVGDEQFVHINRAVLAHDAILGNVEAELGSASDDAGCGCAYPEAVDAAVVARSNRIHQALKATAARHPDLLAALTALPMLARYRVGDVRVGVVHGDADSLAGWRFDAQSLDDPAQGGWLAAAFDTADVDLFASTHTCLPAMRSVARQPAPGWVLNNGAAGMPNFAGDLRGLVTRVATSPSPHEVLHEQVLEHASGKVYAALLPVAIDGVRWQAEFQAQWPPGSAAFESYFDRITHGPDFQAAAARPPRR